MAELIYTFDNPPSERHLSKACGVLESGGVVAYCSDVNWAFACDASSSKGMNRIRFLKPHHSKEKPFSLLCCDISMAAGLCYIENLTYRFLKRAWPGPYTVLLKCRKNLFKQIKDKRKVVGIRIPQSALALALVKMYERPLATTSVPKIGGEPVSFGYEIQDTFGHGCDLILDLGGDMPGTESTIIDFTEEYPQLVRHAVGDPSLFDL